MIDQNTLIELGAVNKLKQLIHSKHHVIAQGSSGALRNLLNSQPDKLAAMLQPANDPKNNLPTLQAGNLFNFLVN